VVEFLLPLLMHVHCEWWVPRTYACTYERTNVWMYLRLQHMSRHSSAETKTQAA